MIDDALIAMIDNHFQTEVAALGDPAALASVLPMQQIVFIAQRKLQLEGEIAGFRGTVKTVSDARAEVEALESVPPNWQKQKFSQADITKRLEDLGAIRTQLCDELLALPQYVRDRADQHKQADLMLSIDSIDHGLHSLPGATAYALKSQRLGALMIERGLVPQYDVEALAVYSYLPWMGSVDELKAALRDVEKKLTMARANLTRAEAALAGLVATYAARVPQPAEK